MRIHSIFQTEKKFMLAESATWNEYRSSWMWSDIPSKTIFELSFSNDRIGKLFEYELPQMCSKIIPLCSKRILVALENKVSIYNLDKKEIKILKDIIHPSEFRCNDGSIGPDGSFWFGTMEKEPSGLNGSIYRLTRDLELINENIKIGIPNNFSWVSSNEIYIADSLLRKLFKVRQDKNGRLEWSKRKEILDCTELGQTPDGGAFDSNFDLFSCIWGGGEVCVIRKNNIINSIKLDCLQPTSCAFGGKNMNYLLLTSAKEGLDNEMINKFPGSGKVNVFKLDIAGKKLNNISLELTNES